ncbi:MAG TPA: crosslink repair DNA glycosylase YcaQ family protein, partial [Bacteroidia bacterium]|nr:crosslink repair DNA glycosylase YcaQ family protein [Bacteroidia bacterium]
MNLSSDEARTIFLKSQGLQSVNTKKGKNKALESITDLGYVQIDTLAVVARAHHHTLWSRDNAYLESNLDELMREKKIYEYWSHAAAYMPMSEYRFSLIRKKLYSSGKIHWFKEDNPKMKKYVIERIRAEGALQSKDFEHVKKTPGQWYEWKPAKRALEQLFMEGGLMVAGRKGFQKIYDLTDRVLPASVNQTIPSSDEFYEHLILKAVSSNGLVSPPEISYLRGHAKAGVEKKLRRMLKEGILERISVSGLGPYYGNPRQLESLLNQKNEIPDVHILSPFDNSVIQRKRLSAFFGFDYFIECYVPEPKRKFGYFCLPVLHGNRFVARFDPKADKASGNFYIKRFFPEKGWKADEAFA